MQFYRYIINKLIKILSISENNNKIDKHIKILFNTAKMLSTILNNCY